MSSVPSTRSKTAEAEAEQQTQRGQEEAAGAVPSEQSTAPATTQEKSSNAEGAANSAGAASDAAPATDNDKNESGRASVCEGCKRPRAEADIAAGGTCEVCDDRKKAAASRNWFALTEVTRASLHEIIQNEHTPSGSATPQPSAAPTNVPAASGVPYFYPGQRVCYSHRGAFAHCVVFIDSTTEALSIGTNGALSSTAGWRACSISYAWMGPCHIPRRPGANRQCSV
jgi:hypothetical protein